MTLTPHPLLVPWSRKSRAIPLLPPMWRTACTEPQCLYRGALYLLYLLMKLVQRLGYRLDNRGSARFLVGTRDFLFSKVSSLQFGPAALSTEVNRPERGADHSLQSSAGVKNDGSCTFTVL